MVLKFKHFVSDLETYSPSLEPIIWYGGVKDDKSNTYIYNNNIEYIEGLLSFTNDKYIPVFWFHNVGYDASQIAYELCKRYGYSRPKRVKEKSIFEGLWWEIYDKDLTKPIMILADTGNYYMGKLADIGLELGIPKGETPIIDDYRFPTKSDINYLLRDLEITEKVLKDYNCISHFESGLHSLSGISKDIIKQKMSSYRKPSFRLQHNKARKEKEVVKEYDGKLKKTVDSQIEKLKQMAKNQGFKVDDNTLSKFENYARKCYTKNVAPNYDKYLKLTLQNKMEVKVRKEISGALKGGLVIVNPSFQNKVINNVIGIDVNSLYPSIQEKYKLPTIYSGKSSEYKSDKKFYIAKVKKLKAKIKNGFIPIFKKPTKYAHDKYDLTYNGVIDILGKKSRRRKNIVTSWDFWITSIDLECLRLYYNIEELEILEYYYFDLDNEYINAVSDTLDDMKILKYNSPKGSLEYINAKIVQNNIWGRTTMVNKQTKMNGYDIDISDHKANNMYGIFVTAMARYELSIMVQYFGIEHFIYCDTDSIFFTGVDIENIKEYLDNKEYGKWSLDKECYEFKIIKNKTYAYRENKGDKIKVVSAGSDITGLIKTFDDFSRGRTFIKNKAEKLPDGRVVIMERPFTL